MKAKFYQLQSKLGLVKFLEMGAGEQDAETTTGKTELFSPEPATLPSILLA